MIKRAYRHGLEKYRFTKKYITFILAMYAIIACLYFLISVFVCLTRDGNINTITKTAGRMYILAGGVPFTLSVPFIATNAQMEKPKSKCWGYLSNANDCATFAPVLFWFIWMILITVCKEYWFSAVAFVVTCAACNAYLEYLAGLYDLIEYMEAVGYAVGKQFTLQRDVTTKEAIKMLDSIVSENKRNNPDFRPIYLQDLEGEVFEKAKEKLRVK